MDYSRSLERVRCGHALTFAARPLYPELRTLLGAASRSLPCQYRKLARLIRSTHPGLVGLTPFVNLVGRRADQRAERADRPQRRQLKFHQAFLPERQFLQESVCLVGIGHV